MITQPIIVFDAVRKTYGSQVILSDLSFHIAAGETVVLMGPSGCGKTTVLRCINGLETIEAGNIHVRDIDLTQVPGSFDWNAFRASIGMVFQQFNLFPHMSVLKNVTLGPVKVKGVPEEAARLKALELLDRVGLSDKAHRFPGNLSGGEKQRVAIARALAMSSDILLLDEPTSALDPLMTAEVLQTLQDLSHQGITMLVVTHEVHFAARAADRILFLNQGRVEANGPPSAFLEGIGHPVARRYFDLLLDNDAVSGARNDKQGPG